MAMDSASELSQFRVTLFVGPQSVQGKPFTHSTVYNVKKRSWKGGVQVAVELDQTQIDRLSAAIGFPRWLEEALATVREDERASGAACRRCSERRARDRSRSSRQPD